MALFKINKDNKPLPSTKTHGYAYFHSGTGEFFVDTSNTERMQLSAQYAQALRSVIADASSSGYTTSLLNVGSATKPVYFQNGLPQECGASLAVSITGNAASANRVSGASLDFYFNDDPEWTWDGLSGNFALNFIGGTNISISPQYDSSNQTYNITLNNDYSLPTASASTKGGVKTGAAITDITGYTACAIKDGVIYYKDTNSTYTLSGLGGIGSVSASGTAPLTLSATKSGTSVTITGSVATATNSSLGVVTTNSTVTSATDLIACPIINGIVYYKDTNTTYTSLKNPSSLTLKVNSSSSALYTYDGSAAKTLNIIAGSNVSVSGDTSGNITISSSYTNTTYSAGTGISLSGTTFSNSGVRSIATGSTNGTISVNTGGTSANVAVKGLGSNAYTSTAYLPLTGGTMSGVITSTYQSSTWQNSATSSVITINHTGYSGWICGPAANGRLVIASYPQQTDLLYFGYYSNGRTENSFDRSMTWNGLTGALTATSVYGAVWNDYAEYRTTEEEIEAGRVVVENGDDTLSLATERLMPGANVVSDTFGFAIGETDTSKTPLAVSGRALVYPYEDRDSYKPGDPVCSGPNGTVSKMTRKEVMQYPDRMIGTVSSIPDYDTWGTGNVEVNGRIWIKIL